MTIQWKVVQPLSEAVSSPLGGLYLQSADGTLLVFAHRRHTGSGRSRRAIDSFWAMDYSGPVPVEATRPLPTLDEVEEHIVQRQASVAKAG